MTTTWTLYGVDGTALPLSDCSAGTIHLGVDPVGVHGLPPVEFDNRPALTLSAGSVRGAARFRERLVVLDLVFHASAPGQVDADIALAAALLNPQLGDCRLVVDNDGTEFDIVLTYSSGFQPARAHAQAKTAKARCTFRAHQPYFRQTSVEAFTIEFPVTGSSVVATDWNWDGDWNLDADWNGVDVGDDGSTIASVDMDATAPTWPRWEIDGPMLGVEIHNATTGQTLAWTGDLVAGETLVIETEELGRSVTVGGVNRWLGLSDDAEFWSLKPGRPGAPQTNVVLIRVDGAAGTTAARMSMRPQWMSPA